MRTPLITTLLLALSMILGCSRQSSDSASGNSDSEQPEVADKKMTSQIDKMCEEILQSPDKMGAADWIKRYPKSAIGKEEETRKPLASVIERFSAAGAPRIVIQYTKLGQGEFLTAMIVELPRDAAARQKCFAMDPELSQLCDQIAVIDRGQKYLHYGFD